MVEPQVKQGLMQDWTAAESHASPIDQAIRDDEAESARGVFGHGRMMRGFLPILAACAFIICALSASAAETAKGLSYRARIEGVDDGGLRDLLKAASNLISEQKRKPLSRAALERRAHDDEDRLEKALDSEGYYSASVLTRIDYSKDPIETVLVVDLGPPFLIAEFSTDYRSGELPEDRGLRDDLRRAVPEIGKRARAETILGAEIAIIDSLQHSGFAFAEIADRQYVIDPAGSTMAVRLAIDQGTRWHFGDIVVEGTKKVDPVFVRQKATFDKGDLFDQKKLDDYRQALLGTGLFESVAVQLRDRNSAEGDQLPVRVRLVDGKVRTVGLGAKYSTTEGPGGRVFWQHRNFMGRSRTVDLAITGAQKRQAFDGGYRQPGFLRPDQTLFSTLTLAHEISDAYTETGGRIALGVERQIKRPLTLSLATEFEVSRLTDAVGTRTPKLITLPAITTYNTSDDFLDPKHGVRAQFRVAPSVGANKGTVRFLTLEANVAGYIPLRKKKPQLVLALRSRVGSILGETVDQIPANRRFYAGGGGSLRPYGYRDVGPLDSSGQPLGGRSVAEIGAEFRIRISQDFGVVPFIEGGNVFTEQVPRPQKGLRWGGGLGFRYFSPLGPLRLDVALPFDRREGIDRRVQIYVSVGQAF